MGVPGRVDAALEAVADKLPQVFELPTMSSRLASVKSGPVTCNVTGTVLVVEKACCLSAGATQVEPDFWALEISNVRYDMDKSFQSTVAATLDKLRSM
mmetsp:Transcript_63299/g.181589  ORF Transcript_63299/g.181589 Transcript_63299/m.181589 type:complete len:98 (-) Transcript_63299:294-587(-)